MPSTMTKLLRITQNIFFQHNMVQTLITSNLLQKNNFIYLCSTHSLGTSVPVQIYLARNRRSPWTVDMIKGAHTSCGWMFFIALTHVIMESIDIDSIDSIVSVIEIYLLRDI